MASKITVIGCNYQGLVTAACYAQLGHNILLVDTDESKTDRLLKSQTPFVGSELGNAFRKSLHNENIIISNQLSDIITHQAPYAFWCLEWPCQSRLKDQQKLLLSYIENLQTPTILINQSHVPLGFCERLSSWLKKTHKNIALVHNPQFLRQDKTIFDFKNQKCLMHGLADPAVKMSLLELVSFLPDETTKMFTSYRNAELAELASRTFLAAKIATANQLLRLINAFNGDIEVIEKSLALDPTLNSNQVSFDSNLENEITNNLLETLQQLSKQSIDLSFLKSIANFNRQQAIWLWQEIEKNYGSKLKHSTIGILGLSSRKENFDLEIDTAKFFINNFLALDAMVLGFDLAVEEATFPLKHPNFKITTLNICLQECDFLLVLTNDPMFSYLSKGTFSFFENAYRFKNSNSMLNL